VKSQNVVVTMFESQLFRNYLLSDQGFFLKELSKHFQVTIWTEPSMSELIQKNLSSFGLKDIRISVFNPLPESFLTRVFGFYLKWALIDTGTKVALETRYLNNEISKYGRLLRNCLWQSKFQKKLISKFARIGYSLSVQLAHHKLSKHLKIWNIEKLFVTSATNLAFDVPLAILAKRQGAKTYLTVRSWDNLSLHGILRFSPDLFLAQSLYMSKLAIQNHYLSKSQVKQIPSITYRDSWAPHSRKNSKRKLVVYAAGGIRTSPDEKVFLQQLLDFWLQKLDYFDLIILQHPAEVNADVSQRYLRSGLSVKKFDYCRDSLPTYYAFLAEASIVICAGSTVILDAIFCRREVALVGFESPEVPYWKSSLRSFDMRPHTRDLLKLSQINVCKSFNELREKIENAVLQLQPVKVYPDRVFEILGLGSSDFNAEIISVLEDF
jgi:hypothetical protein